MKRGKRICSELKAVRRRIADENGIKLHQDECKHTGDCLGTCPKCEAEVRYLEQALTQRVATGHIATVAGLTLSLAACGGTAEPTLSVDTPLDTLPADTTFTSDTIINTETDIPCPDIPILGEPEIVCGFEIVDEIDTSCSPTEGEIGPTDEAIKEEVMEGEAEIYVFPDEYPSFPGGEKAVYDFIEKNLHYPDSACEADIEGSVVVRFVIEKDGTIGRVLVIRDIGGGCGKEAARVVKMMPKWNPAKNNGKPVRFEFSLPIKFSFK